MSLFIPTIPEPDDNLDFSQKQLLSNNAGLDTVFGIDHYNFSDASSNKGFHNEVTTPVFTAAPPTPPYTPSVTPPITTTNPILYAFQQTTPIGAIQFSRGPSNAVPSPLTRLNSTAAATVLNSVSTLNLLDFTGLNQAYVKVYAYNSLDMGGFQANIEATCFWSAAIPAFIINIVTDTSLTTPIGFTIQSSGNILQLKNTSGSNYLNVYWTIELIRVQ